MVDIRHAKTDTYADGTNTDLVRPIDWNSQHLFTLIEAVAYGGNTTGTMATIDSGTLVIAGGDNITLSQDGQTVTIIGAAGGTGGGLTNIRVSAGGSNALLSALTFSNGSGVSFGLSAGTITASVKTDYQSSGPYLTTAMRSDAATISDVVFSAGTLSALRSDVSFDDSNGVSFGLDTNGIITATVRTNYQSSGAYLTTAMKSDAATISAVKFSASGGSVAASDFTFANSNGFTFGIDTAARQITASYTVPTVPAQSNQTLGVYGVTNTFDASSGTIDARSVSVKVYGSLSVGVSNGSLELSAPNALTTAMGSDAGSNFVAASAAFAGTNASGTIASNGISVSVAAPAAAGLSVGIQASGIVIGTTGLVASQLVLVPIGPAFISQSRNGDSATLSFGALPVGVTTAGLTAGATGNWVGDAYLVGDNVTLSVATQTRATNNVTRTDQSIHISAAAQSNQSVGLYASSNTYLSTSGTADARSLSFRGDASITVGISSDGEVCFSVGAYLTTAALSQNTSNYAGINGSIVGGSLTLNTSGATISLPAYLTTAQPPGAYLTTAMQSNAVTLSNIAVSAGSTSQLLSSIVFSNSNGLSFGLSGSTITAAQPVMSFFDPNWGFNWANSATSTFGVGTLYLNELSAPNNVSFGQVNMIGSAAMISTTAGNTVTVGLSAASFRFEAFYSISAYNLVDLFLFSYGGGGSSTDLVTLGSTRNSFLTVQNHTYDVSATMNVSTASLSIKSSVSVVASFPSMTSNTVTSVNAATTVTTWAQGYGSWSSSASTSTSSTWNTTASSTQSVSIAGTWPATTAWASNKLIPMAFPTSLSQGLYWIGMARTTSTSSSSASSASNVAAGHTYTTSINASALTQTAQISWVGSTYTIASSLGYMGGNTAASMAPGPAQGTFASTYAASKTFYNNAGQANGEIALSDVATNASFWDNWFQLASQRI